MSPARLEIQLRDGCGLETVTDRGVRGGSGGAPFTESISVSRTSSFPILSLKESVIRFSIYYDSDGRRTLNM